MYLIERCILSMIAFKLTTRLKGKGTPIKAFGTCGKYCFRSINDVRVGGAGPYVGAWPAGLAGLRPWPARPPPLIRH